MSQPTYEAHLVLFALSEQQPFLFAVARKCFLNYLN